MGIELNGPVNETAPERSPELVHSSPVEHLEGAELLQAETSDGIKPPALKRLGHRLGLMTLGTGYYSDITEKEPPEPTSNKTKAIIAASVVGGLICLKLLGSPFV